MTELTPAEPVAVSSPPAAAPVARDLLPRWLAMLQAFFVCGIPTQIIVASVLWLGFGIEPLEEGHVTLQFFAMLSLFDTAFVAALIYAFLLLSGESSRDVLVGRLPVAGEVLRGLALVPAVFIGVVGLVLALRAVAPALHNVRVSPLEGFLATPLDAAIFFVVVVLAGGVREELQRAFILHRFDQSLGGVKLGLVIFSITFGVLHVDQGYDVAIAIGTAGLFWGLLYVWRRSAIAPMVSHAGFNAAQVAQVMLARVLGLV